MKKLTVIFSLLILTFMVTGTNAEPVVDNFNITVGTDGTVVTGGGTGYNEGMWYLYPESGWINQWFYNAPYDPARGKIIHIEFDLVVNEPGVFSSACVAVNWSTPEWSDFGYDYPPLPGEVGQDECLYIERVVLDDICPVPEVITHYVFDYIVYDYNPEWVSIDVMGENFEILNGVIEHECVDKETGTGNETWGSVKSLYR